MPILIPLKKFFIVTKMLHNELAQFTSNQIKLLQYIAATSQFLSQFE
jgi:hypothetical protein